jgi:acetolactate synthase-1/2/3 large subunit
MSSRVVVMKLSDYVIDFLTRLGVTRVFGMSGGAAVHLFDSVARHPDIDYLSATHEQCAAMAADGYARASGRIGVAITTSGPGATNLLTGVCCSYYDSVPTLLITGQVATHRLKGDRPVRQVGFQETDVLSIFSTVTKYAVQIRDPNSIRYHLEKAVHIAFEGRPGPVLIDLPDDLQRAEVDPETMAAFTPETPAVSAAKLEQDWEKFAALLAESKRPVLVLGGGLKTPPVPRELLDGFVTRLSVPVLLTWAGLDLLTHDHSLRVGPFGVYGPRPGNFAVQNADLILCIGSRLSQNITGGILNSFARAATIVMVDADAGEMGKFDGRGIEISLRIQARAEDFLRVAVARLETTTPRECAAWCAKIRHWQEVFPIERSHRLVSNRRFVDAYDVVAALSVQIPEGETIFVDTGGNLTWTCNGLRVKRGQRVFSAWNNTPMGYALPAAIGAGCWNRNLPITCIIGDGGLMLCLGELATVIHHQLPIRILLFNNHCHGIQKQTLETWLGGRYEGVHPESGLAFPDFEKVATAMGFEVITIDDEATMVERLAGVYSRPGPVFCNVEINPDQKLYPVVKFGAALENQLPLLEEQLIKSEMLVEPFKAAPGHTARTGTAGV